MLGELGFTRHAAPIWTRRPPCCPSDYAGLEKPQHMAMGELWMHGALESPIQRMCSPSQCLRRQ